VTSTIDDVVSAACAPTTPDAPLSSRRGEDSLTDRDRTTAHALRRTAAIVAAAGLPSEYRAVAFYVLSGRMIDRAHVRP
jgi:hypothetical protein